MTDDNVPAKRPAFVVQDYFLETAFEVRFQGLLRQAWRERSWHVIAALPGSGKSLGIADMTHQSNVYKDSRGATHFPLLAIRAPKNGGTDLALGTAFCTIFGIVPSMPWYIRRAWLVQTMAEAGVEARRLDQDRVLVTDLGLAKALAQASGFYHDGGKGRPREQHLLTDMTTTQKHLADLFNIHRYAPTR